MIEKQSKNGAAIINSPAIYCRVYLAAAKKLLSISPIFFAVIK